VSLAAATDKFCRVCGGLFHPRTSMASICGPVCATKYAKGLDKDREVKAKAERAQTKARKEKIKTIPDLIKEAQREFNSFIRARDRHSGARCISSGQLLDWSGNGVDAGHYRSVGSAPHLRFDERNCHAQSKHDNQWRSGNVVAYRLGLIERIGLEAVEALESDNRIHKWQRDELIAIKNKYRAMRKELEKNK
jgi:hypothetical protein